MTQRISSLIAFVYCSSVLRGSSSLLRGIFVGPSMVRSSFLVCSSENSLYIVFQLFFLYTLAAFLVVIVPASAIKENIFLRTELIVHENTESCFMLQTMQGNNENMKRGVGQEDMSGLQLHCGKRNSSKDIRPRKKKMFLVRISVKKRESGRAVFLLFIIFYCMLSLHIITFPRDTLELLGQILIKRNIRY